MFSLLFALSYSVHAAQNFELVAPNANEEETFTLNADSTTDIVFIGKKGIRFNGPYLLKEVRVQKGEEWVLDPSLTTQFPIVLLGKNKSDLLVHDLFCVQTLKNSSVYNIKYSNMSDDPSLETRECLVFDFDNFSLEQCPVWDKTAFVMESFECIQKY